MSGAAEAGPLRNLARRTGRNREVLGVHYPSDTLCGQKMAARMLPLILNCPTVLGTPSTTINPMTKKPDNFAGTTLPHADVGLDGTKTEPVNGQGRDFYADGLLAKARREWQ